MKAYTIPTNLCLLLVILFTICYADEGVWQKTGSPFILGTIEDIGVGHYSTTRHVFAAESSAIGAGYLWHTTDDGQSWSKADTIIEHYYRRVRIQATNFIYGWALVPGNSDNDENAGPKRTTNGGGYWELRDQGLSGHKKLYALASDPATNMTTAFVGGWGTTDKLFKTADGGGQWTTSQTGIPPTPGTINDISICGDNSGRMVCAYEADPGYSASGLYISSNGGTNWTSWQFDAQNPTATAMAVAIDYSSIFPEVVEVFVVEKSPDFGKIWMYSGNQPPYQWYSISPANTNMGECHSIRIYNGNENKHYFAFITRQPNDRYQWVREYCPG